MHIVTGRQFGHRRFLAKRLQRNLRLQLSGITPSLPWHSRLLFLGLDSTLASCPNFRVHLCLPPGERADLVGLQLFGDEAGRPPVAKSATHRGSPLEPAGHGVPGQPFDPGDRRPTDTLNAQRDDRVERRPAMLEAVIGGTFRRRERLAASHAPVAGRPTGTRRGCRWMSRGWWSGSSRWRPSMGGMAIGG